MQALILRVRVVDDNEIVRRVICQILQSQADIEVVWLFFGHEPLCDLLLMPRDLSPAMAADSIVSSVRQWSGKQDDLTVLICDYTPRIDECGTALRSRC
jgi:CheY-like chemotaxis protein